MQAHTMRPETGAKPGDLVREFERQFAEYVGAKYAVAMCNGTATLHAAVASLGWETVAVPPLTMSSTALAVIHAGAHPVFTDVDPHTFLMSGDEADMAMPVSLYGYPVRATDYDCQVVDDAAQTMRKHDPDALFTSYSFQSSKILNTHEGGMLVTDEEWLAERARSFASLGYPMEASKPQISKVDLKSPRYARHHAIGYNYRMADAVAGVGLAWLGRTNDGRQVVDIAKLGRRMAAGFYSDAVGATTLLTPQAHHPEHDYWAYAVVAQNRVVAETIQHRMEVLGAEVPYRAWMLSYEEPAIETWLIDNDVHVPDCPVAEDIQSRLLQFQTNNLEDAKRNADALAQCIREIEG